MTVVTTADQPGAPERSGAPGAAPSGTADPMASEQIARLRERIDEIDATMIALWRERAALSQQVGAARVASGGTRLALSREQQVLDRFHQALGPIGTQLGLLVLRAGRGPL
jgi:chorismate mutase